MKFAKTHRHKTDVEKSNIKIFVNKAVPVAVVENLYFRH